MSTWNELKEKVSKSERFKSLSQKNKEKLSKELFRAKIAYENGVDLLEKFNEKRGSLKEQYVLPYLLNHTDNILDDKLEQIQVKEGASGGIDIDSDFSGEGRDKIYKYLREKYGDDRVLHVGTTSTLGPASAVKDISRVYGLDFGKTNELTKVLEKDVEWKENIENIKYNYPPLYKFYQDHLEVFELVPHFINKTRHFGRHAGGVVVLPDPVYNHIPVDRVNGEIVTAFPESGSESTLDEVGIVKYDILGISILDVIGDAIDLIDEDLYLIEDDDGIEKIVGESYLKQNSKNEDHE